MTNTIAADLRADLATIRRAWPLLLTARADGPATPDEAVPGPSGALGRPGSENTPADTYPHKNVPESPSA